MDGACLHKAECVDMSKSGDSGHGLLLGVLMRNQRPQMLELRQDVSDGTSATPLGREANESMCTFGEHTAELGHVQPLRKACSIPRQRS